MSRALMVTLIVVAVMVASLVVLYATNDRFRAGFEIGTGQTR